MEQISQTEIVARLRELGVEVSYRKLTDWTSKGFLPPAEKIGLGRPRGTSQLRDPAVVEQAVAAHFLMEFHTNADATLLGLWFCGYQVDSNDAHVAWIELLERTQRRRERSAATFSGGFVGLGKSWWRKQPDLANYSTLFDQAFLSDMLEWIFDEDQRDDEAFRNHIALIVNRVAGRSEDEPIPLRTYELVEKAWGVIQPQSFFRITEVIDFVHSLSQMELEFARVQLAAVRRALQHTLKITNSMEDIDEGTLVFATTRLMQDFLGPTIVKLLIALRRHDPSLPVVETINVLQNFVLNLDRGDISEKGLSGGALQRFEPVKLDLEKLWELPDG